VFEVCVFHTLKIAGVATNRNPPCASSSTVTSQEFLSTPRHYLRTIHHHNTHECR
jgi:hypothetical protein